mmetsp:Transcript_11447/g.44309  ORF Transcript_11447/g.44309 Transcript_11447/m.44309 type:complete len:259 (-) Transcript_11447:439-1215(-)
MAAAAAAAAVAVAGGRAAGLSTLPSRLVLSSAAGATPDRAAGVLPSVCRCCCRARRFAGATNAVCTSKSRSVPGPALLLLLLLLRGRLAARRGLLDGVSVAPAVSPLLQSSASPGSPSASGSAGAQRHSTAAPLSPVAALFLPLDAAPLLAAASAPALRRSPSPPASAPSSSPGSVLPGELGAARADASTPAVAAASVPLNGRPQPMCPPGAEHAGGTRGPAAEAKAGASAPPAALSVASSAPAAAGPSSAPVKAIMA